MHILVIDNDHLPHLNGDSIHKETLKKPNANIEPYDAWVSNELTRIFHTDKYDMIVLPYSLSSSNYMDYSGLRVAMHIRLTQEWGHTRKPILFVGCESPDFVAKFSSVGDILFTPYVFTTNDSLRSLDKWENYVQNKFSMDMSDHQYAQFIYKVHVNPPANYGTHHSIANEWAISRWIEMLGMYFDGINTNFKSLLFYKYLRASLGKEQMFNSKWHRDNPSPAKIGNLEPGEKYKIAYIDDEYTKGWGSILKFICKENKFEEPAIFSGFHHDESKEQLIEDIKKFIDENDADCYLLDLRLHDDDFKKDTKSEDITGHKIARYIRAKNSANQIVIFTASNKVWNLKEDLMEIGAAGYVIKESPEMKYNREQTCHNFHDFLREILHACRQSYIKKYVEFLKDKNYPTLDTFVELLLLMDKTKKKKDVLPSLLLQLVVFIETHIKENFIIQDGDNLSRKDSSWERDIGKKIRFRKEKDGKGHSNLVEVSCSEKPTPYDSYFNEYAKTKDKYGNVIDITIILAALKYYYEFTNTEVNFVLQAKNQRNKHVAHNGTEIEMNLKDIKRLFEDIVVNIIKKDN